MNSELIVLTIGFTIMYTWTLVVAAADIIRTQKENRNLRRELLELSQILAIRTAAKEGDFETARLMAAVKRETERVKPKPPVSAGAKEMKPTGIVLTEGEM